MANGKRVMELIVDHRNTYFGLFSFCLSMACFATGHWRYGLLNLGACFLNVLAVGVSVYNRLEEAANGK